MTPQNPTPGPPGKRTSGPAPDGNDQYTGFVIVRLDDPEPADDDVANLRTVPRRHKLGKLSTALTRLQPSSAGPLITNTPPRRIRALESRAQDSPLPPLRSLTRYVRVDLRDSAIHPVEATESLHGLPGVANAHPEERATEPAAAPNPDDDPASPRQHHFDNAPVGISARWVWEHLEVDWDAAGVGFLDLERAWHLNHEDLVAINATLLFGEALPARHPDRARAREHGTSVLGIVAAADNTAGGIGIAPWARPVRVASHYRAADNSDGHVADTILAVTRHLSPGDVLLLEVQRGFGTPTETQTADLDAIRLAVAHGIVVIEAAGNGVVDLDTWTDEHGVTRLNRTAGPDSFIDSGAILVGSCTADPAAAPPAGRLASSSFGSRVDCFARGENVTTTGMTSPLPGRLTSYTDYFGGTSAASAIIASAALTVQALSFAATGQRLDPPTLRAMLTAPRTAAACLPDAGIGVMPDLRAIATGPLGLAPPTAVNPAIHGQYTTGSWIPTTLTPEAAT